MGELERLVREALADRLGSGGIGAVRAMMAVNAAVAVDSAKAVPDIREMLAAQAQLETLLGKVVGDGAVQGGGVADVVGAGPSVRDSAES